MPLIRLIGWKDRKLKVAGFTVDDSPYQSSRFVTRMRELTPAVVLIDLDKAPSHGRAIAILLRSSKGTRDIPLVFAGGAPEKIERVRRDLPGSVFTDWKNVARAVKQAIRGGPQPAVPNYMRQFHGTSLPLKLGLKKEVALIHAPEDFEERVGDVEGVVFRPAVSRNTNLVVWFVRSRAELEDGLDLMAARLPPARSMWIAYPKRAGRYATDLTQNELRARALESGLVDYKICAIDEHWSALKFTRKR